MKSITEESVEWEKTRLGGGEIPGGRMGQVPRGVVVLVSP